MDNKDYLNQISLSNRPQKKSKLSFMSSPIFKVSIVGLILLIMIIIIGAVISGGKTSLKDRLISLKLHVDSTSEVISDYQGILKSSDLRSNSASLSGILSNASRGLSEYLTSKYSYKEGKDDKKLQNEADLRRDELEDDLFKAKINGKLDITYAHKMAYEISSINTEIESIQRNIKDDASIDFLNSTHDSLNILYDNFNDTSNIK